MTTLVPSLREHTEIAHINKFKWNEGKKANIVNKKTKLDWWDREGLPDSGEGSRASQARGTKWRQGLKEEVKEEKHAWHSVYPEMCKMRLDRQARAPLYRALPSSEVFWPFFLPSVQWETMLQF